jgi:electron transfer flavoprotein beta subunit
MKILVPIKRVSDPDNANKIKVSADGARVTTEGLEWKMNPFDEYALEAALRLNENGATKERFGEIVIVSIGPKDTDKTLRKAFAMGADRGILVEGEDDELDTHIVTDILKKIVEKERPELVLMGKQTVDADSNAGGQVLAEKLGWPMATLVMRITTDDDGKTDLGVMTLRIKPPAVLTASDRIIHPQSVKNGKTPKDFAYPESEGGRYATLKGIMAANKKPIETLSRASLGVEVQRFVRYVRFAPVPARSGKATFVKSAAELVEKLHKEAKVV